MSESLSSLRFGVRAKVVELGAAVQNVNRKSIMESVPAQPVSPGTLASPGSGKKPEWVGVSSGVGAQGPLSSPSRDRPHTAKTNTPREKERRKSEIKSGVGAKEGGKEACGKEGGKEAGTGGGVLSESVDEG